MVFIFPLLDWLSDKKKKRNSYLRWNVHRDKYHSICLTLAPAFSLLLSFPKNTMTLEFSFFFTAQPLKMIRKFVFRLTWDRSFTFKRIGSTYKTRAHFPFLNCLTYLEFYTKMKLHCKKCFSFRISNFQNKLS